MTCVAGFITVPGMNWFARIGLLFLIALALPHGVSAAITYTPGIGWYIGGTDWIRYTPKEQLQVAQNAFDKKDYSLAILASKRIVGEKRWKFTDFGRQAEYLIARCYEAKGQDERAFKAYQSLIDDHPQLDNYEEVIKRQFLIANRFLGGQYYRAFNTVPLFRSMEKTIKLYEQIIKNGPYSEVAPAAQMNIGLAHENKKGLFIPIPDYAAAAKAYEKAAERYSERPIGAEALYRQAMAYTKDARRAEYDQTVAGQAIATFTDFMALHPEDTRNREAQKIIESLKTEQARGSFEIARFYEKRKSLQGALIYYNDVLLKDPGSKYANVARQRIDSIMRRRS